MVAVVASGMEGVHAVAAGDAVGMHARFILQYDPPAILVVDCPLVGIEIPGFVQFHQTGMAVQEGDGGGAAVPQGDGVHAEHDVVRHVVAGHLLRTGSPGIHVHLDRVGEDRLSGGVGMLGDIPFVPPSVYVIARRLGDPDPHPDQEIHVEVAGDAVVKTVVQPLP